MWGQSYHRMLIRAAMVLQFGLGGDDTLYASVGDGNDYIYQDGGEKT